MERIKGRILNGIGGFYYVETDDGVIECKPRGVFRKQGIIPLAGDYVTLSIQDQQGTIEDILPRKNAMVRPPVANIDCLVIVISMVQPVPNLQIVDTMIAVAEDKEIEPIIVINKSDLANAEEIEKIYANAGFKTFVVSAKTSQGIAALKSELNGRDCAFTGNTGAGKSSIMNLLKQGLSLETGETSQKLGRGKHTTRMSTLYHQEGSGYYIDTPGFSSLAVEKLADISIENLPYCFREFAEYLGKCKFTSCKHIHEKGCAVCAALEEGKIDPSRYASYEMLLDNIQKATSFD